MNERIAPCADGMFAKLNAVAFVSAPFLPRTPTGRPGIRFVVQYTAVSRWRGTVWAMIDERLIVEAGRRLAAAAPGAQVILFGSHARGEAAPHSDLDFLVVEPDVDDDGAEAVRLMRVLRDLRVPTDVIVVSERYAEDWRDVRGTLVHAALSQGRLLTG